MTWTSLATVIDAQLDLAIAAVLVVGVTVLIVRRLPALISTRTMAVAVVVSTLVCVALTVGLTWTGDMVQRGRVADELKTEALTFAGEFERLDHAGIIRGTAGPGATEALIAQQARLHRRNPALGAIYTFRPVPGRPGEWDVLFDDEIDLDGDGRIRGVAERRDPPGVERFTDTTAAVESAAAGTAAVNETVTYDAGGTWISGYAPLYLTERMEVVDAVLGVDLPAEVWVFQRLVGRAIGLTVGAIVTVLQLLGMVLLGLTRSRFETSREQFSQSEAVGLLSSGEVIRSLPLRLDRFKLVRLLGRGGMGVVYAAEDSLRREPVAIKFLDTGLTANTVSQVRFAREIENLRRCHHPNLVAAYEASTIAGVQALVMELVPGTSVATLVPPWEADGPDVPPLTVADACEIARQAAEGLGYLHQRGIIHRDVKPGNLMVRPDGVVKLLDLGLSRLMETTSAETPLTKTKQILGSYDYLAPEMAMSGKQIDGRVDLYGLGGTLMKMLTGRGPFEDERHVGFAAKLLAHVGETPPDVRTITPEVPAEVAAVVARLLGKTPEDRFATGEDVAAALSPFCAGANLPTLGRSDPLVTPGALQPRRRRVEADSPGDAGQADADADDEASVLEP